MNMNRRKLFSFFAAAPVAGIAVLSSEAKQITNIVPNFPKPHLPVGYMFDEPFFRNIAPIPMTRRMIYDGERFVEFESPEGAAVLNRIMAAGIAHR